MKCTLYATGVSNNKGREFKCRHSGCDRVSWFPHSVSDERIARLAAECGLGKVGPGMGLRILTYAEELAKWTLAGCPVRSPEQMAENQAICQACELFAASRRDPTRGSCKLCSCALNSRRNPTNKHYMGTTNCPHPTEPKWLAISGENDTEVAEPPK